MPTVVRDLPLLDAILSEWRETIGADYVGYRNHVCRVVNFAFALGDWREEQKRRIVIAGAFHDLGIWSAGTADYLPPSIALARDWLAREGLERLGGGDRADDRPAPQDHPLSRYALSAGRGLPPGRSGGCVTWYRATGLPVAFVGELKRVFPNAGFHWRLVKLFGQGLAAHPLHPIPIFRW